MQEFSGPNDGLSSDLYGSKDRPESIAEDLTVAGDGSARLEARLMADLAVGEMRLARVFLAAANTATAHRHDALHGDYLRKAFVIVCEARFRLLQLPALERDLFFNSLLADELQLLQTQVLDALSEDA